MSLNNSIITQSIGIPYQQYVTSSAGHTLISSSTYFNDTSDNIPRYKDASGNIYDAIISSSYALTASHALNSGGGGDPFPFTGDAQITGSLIVSGSFNAFRVVSTNLVLGTQAGENLNPSATGNVILGNQAGMEGSSTTQNNVFIGDSAGEDITGTSRYNVFLGLSAGKQGTGKTDNVGIGYNALGGRAASDSADGNVAIGYNAANNSLNASYTIALGYNAVAGNASSGFSGRGNIGIGRDSISNLGTSGGTYNTAIGYYAGATISSGDANIIIGSGSRGEAAMSNQLRMGHADVIAISGSLTTGDVIFYNTASAPNFSGSFQGDGSNLTGIVASTATTASYVETSEYTTRWNVTNNGSSAYRFDGNGVGASDDNPDIYLTRGEKYLFNVNASGHPFEIRVANGGSAYSDGVTNNAAATGNVIFEVQMDAPTSLVYQCTNHGGMVGNIYIIDQTFPFTGDAVISGSAEVTGSFKVQGASGNVLNIGNDGSFTLGQGASGTNNNPDTSVVIGKNATVTSDDSVVIGDGATTNTGGQKNVVIGHGASVIGNTSFGVVVGENAYVSGTNGIALGRSSTAAGDGIAIGRDSNVSGNRGIAIGKGATAGTDQLLIGHSSTYEPIISGSLETGHIILSQTSSDGYSQGGLEVHGSGSNVFEVIGSEGTLFSVDDDLDGTIFTANDRTGLPVLQAEADGEDYLGKTPQSLYTTAVVSATSASSTASLIALSTSSYDSAYFDFTCISASNSTVGSIMSTWNGETIAFNEHATSSIGTTYRTAGLDLQVIISASQAQLVAITDSTSPNTWKIKTTVRAI